MAARVGGRNVAASWIVGVLCCAVIAGLAWIAAPTLPFVIQTVGDMLRESYP